MLGDFLRAGYEIEPTDPTKANLIVVNTCGFLKSARDEVSDPPRGGTVFVHLYETHERPVFHTLILKYYVIWFCCFLFVVLFVLG
jgi:hypothetical protein